MRGSEACNEVEIIEDSVNIVRFKVLIFFIFQESKLIEQLILLIAKAVRIIE